MKTSVALSLALALLTAIPASAGTVRWNLLNVTFNDGGTASGYFVIDTDFNVHPLPDYSIFVTAGSTFGALQYQYSNQWNQAGHLGTQFNFYGPVGTSRFLVLQPIAQLTSSTGTVPLNIGGLNYECNNCGTTRYVVSGSVTTDNLATPEPGTYGMLLSGIAGVFIQTRRRRK